MVQQPSIAAGRNAHGLAAQRLGQPEVVALKRHPAARLDPAHLVVGAVGQGRQLGRIRSGG